MPVGYAEGLAYTEPDYAFAERIKNTMKLPAINVVPSADHTPVRMWNSADYRAKDAFSFFREELCATGMLWLPSIPAGEKEFQIAIKARDTDKGRIVRFSSATLDLERGKAEIEKSTIDYVSVGLILSGSMTVDQDGPRTFNAGDLFVHDLTRPIQMNTRDGNFQTIGLVVERNQSEEVDKRLDLLRGTHLIQNNVSIPLRSCFYFLNEQLTSSEQELNAIQDAVLALLPVSTNSFGANEVAFRGNVKAMYREILLYIEGNLQNPDLNPRMVAIRFSISERYLFRLFAEHGVRFGAYLKNRRLEGVSADLASRNGQGQPITETAYKWGFNDLSTFNRSFKEKYHCSPSEYKFRF